ncbi:MAG: DUF2058 domain-containing protein [Cocleimonas sp.]|nr:DUF2058 domain-containing protein [Cocleimonas sp.]
MANSLQDQLLGIGLSNKQKARNINSAKKKAIKKSRQENTELKNKAAELAGQARDAQRRKSQHSNAQHNQQAEQKAIAAQIRQIIEMNSIEKAKNDQVQAYNFNDANKIKTVYVSTKNHDLISRGRIAIAKLEQGYHLIPMEAANKINERDNNVIVLLNDPQKQQEGEVVEDDPYADYQIPDDLMW